MSRTIRLTAVFSFFCLLLSAQVFHLDFRKLTEEQKASIKNNGEVAYTPDGLVSTSSKKAPVSGVLFPTKMPEIPNGFDGKVCRVTWNFIPDKIGGWGSDLRICQAMVVELTGTRPTLNAKHPAKSLVKEKQLCVMTCDFSSHAIFSWTIDGVEQLTTPVPVWNNGHGIPRVELSDFSDTNSQTTWQEVKIEIVQTNKLREARTAAWGDYPAIPKDKKLNFLLGQANPMQKVFREAQLFPGTLNPRVSIAAAGRERESFQLVLFPLDRPVKNVRITIDNLQHVDFKSPDFPSSRISWSPVGYVRTVYGDKCGWQWPDILMPAKPFDVAPGFVQPVWFTVDVPDGTAPGDYHGFIHFQADGMEEQIATLSLTVRPFSLPLRGKLKTAFCICPGMWEIWYKPDEVKKRLNLTDKNNHGPLYTSYECEDVLPKEKWLGVYDFLLAHRLNPSVIYSGLKRGKARTLPAMEDMQYCYDRGMNANCLVCIGDISEKTEEAQKYLQDLNGWLKHWEKFVKEKNWPDFTWYLHSYDETEMRPQEQRKHFDYAINTTHQYVAKNFPWIKRESANPFIERHKNNFDIWTPLTNQLSDKALPKYRAAQAAGQEVWAYVCCGPGQPYANLFIDMDGVCPRVLPWQFYQYKLTGFLYYLMNFYEGTKNWNKNAPKWPNEEWNTDRCRTNSDGILFYPGPDATPLASTRLENLRDGLEDYEALAMLQELLATFKPQTDADKALADEATALLQVPSELSKSWQVYTKDAKVIYRNREKVDALIARLQK